MTLLRRHGIDLRSMTFHTYRVSAVAMTLSILCAGGVAASTAAENPSTIHAGAIRAHLEFLASDLLEGRDAGTRGYDLAANYVASMYEQIGLQPAGTKGFMQPVPLRSSLLVPNSVRLSSRARAGSGRSPTPTTSPRARAARRPSRASKPTACSRASASCRRSTSATTTQGSMCAASSSWCSAAHRLDYRARWPGTWAPRPSSARVPPSEVRWVFSLSTRLLSRRAGRSFDWRRSMRSRRWNGSIRRSRAHRASSCAFRPSSTKLRLLRSSNERRAVCRP